MKVIRTLDKFEDAVAKGCIFKIPLVCYIANIGMLALP